MANSEISYRYIAGNHDWHFEGSGPDIPQPELRRRWIKKLAPLYAGENPDGYSVQAGGANFVLIDNSANEISKEQLAFFKSELAGECRQFSAPTFRFTFGAAASDSRAATRISAP